MLIVRKFFLITIISLLGLCSLTFAMAPESIKGMKITFDIVSDSETIIFYATEKDSVYSFEKSGGFWAYEKVLWQKTGTSEASMVLFGGETEVKISFDTESTGTFSYSSDNGDNGNGTFKTSNYSEGEIPVNRYFNDTFSNLTKSTELWPLEDYSGISKSLDDGLLLISGSLTEPDDRWYDIKANTILNLENNWVINGSSFSDVNYTSHLENETWYFNSATIGVDIITENNEEVSFHIGISHDSIRSQIWVDKTDSFEYVDISTSERKGTFRLVNSPADNTLSSQYLNNSSWKTIQILNWKNGVLTHVDGKVSYNHETNFELMQTTTTTEYSDINVTLSNWTDLNNAHLSPGIRFEIPCLRNTSNNEFKKIVPFDKGDIGFSSFSIVGDGENASTYNSDTEKFIQQNNSKGWMWFDHYPWVYSSKENSWLYFYPRENGKIYIYNKSKNLWQLLDR